MFAEGPEPEPEQPLDVGQLIRSFSIGVAIGFQGTIGQKEIEELWSTVWAQYMSRKTQN